MLGLLKTIAGLRSALEKYRKNQTIGLVPTMGALHPGHLSLIERAIAETDVIVVSIFVNPIQFGPKEDLARYPRQLEKDYQTCQELGVDLVFAPEVAELYQNSPTTQVIPPPEMTAVLCGRFRPGHFQGVATVVTKLLNIVQPSIAYFGEKDAQQLAIIERLVQDLNLPVEIRRCPIFRETSGLAYSSRNQYLSPEEKNQALALSRGLRTAELAFTKGEVDGQKLISLVQNELREMEVEYVELVHPNTLQPLTQIRESGLLAIACKIGTTRLIDNLIFRQRQPIIAIDGPAGAGKSTVTRRVAQALGLTYLDTGAMYRAVTWLVMASEIELTDEEAIADLVSGIELVLIAEDGTNLTRVLVNNRDVTEAIRTPEVTKNVSDISAQSAVRQKLVELQRQMGEKGGIIAEGRDIGTNVFPDAELKIFLTASVQERAKRRLRDFQNQGETTVNLEVLAEEIQQRDYQDSTRKISPLKQANDAVKIITDNLSIEEVTAKIISLYRNLTDRRE